MKRLHIFACIGLTLGALATITPTESKAQFSNFLLTKAATSSGVDSIVGTISYPASLATSATVAFVPLTGTSGRIVLMGSNLGSDYTRMDSVTVNFLGANGANAGSQHEFTFNNYSNPTKYPGVPSFWLYKFVYYQTTGSVTAAKGRALVRTGGSN